MDSLYSLRNIKLTYKSADGQPIEALRNLDLDIFTNEYLAIVGANGCGKSSLAKLLAGVADAFTGQIHFRGQHIVEYSRRLFDDVSLTIQEPQNQLLMTTVYDELSFPLENRGLKQDEIAVRIARIARQFNIEDILDMETDRLSGGQISAVSIASALIVEPKIVILDEPDSHLDKSTRIALEKYIDENRGRITVIIVTQYPDFAKLAERMVVMKDGQVVADGKPEELFSDSELMIDCRLAIPKRTVNSFARGGVDCRAKHSRPLISFSEVGYSYGVKKNVLDNINIDIYPGERVAIVGPIGSGKTTLGLLMAGLLKADTGKITLDGRSIDSYDDTTIRKLITIAMQFPERALIEESVFSDIAFGPNQIGISDYENVTKSVMHRFRIDDLADKNPLDLSTGQKRKVALAGIFAMQCPIIILDEPTASLDPQSSADLADIICTDESKTFVILGHDLQFLAAVCDRIIGLDAGKMIFQKPMVDFLNDIHSGYEK